jgi:hypothetical protein
MLQIITNNSSGFHKNILFNLLTELGYVDIVDFQKRNGLTADGMFGMMSYNKLYSILLKVEAVDFEGYYFKAAFPKNQIIWHHSAGWDNVRGMFEWWKNDKAFHVATAIGINDEGKVYRGFDESFWAASIGCTSDIFIANGVPLKYVNGRVANNVELDQAAVAVEVGNWGSLTFKDGKYYSWANAVVPAEKAIELNYKYVKFYEAYTDAEIKTLKYWTLLNAIRFQIPVDYSYDDFFKVSKKALSGQKGVFTHNSYRSDKSDVSPQPKLIKMAESMIEYTK